MCEVLLLCKLQASCVRASRAYYTAHAALSGGKALEALALFGRATERAAAAKAAVGQAGAAVGGAAADGFNAARMEQLGAWAQAFK